jgi:5-methylcytosine-specific restriction endonuclease McrA
MKNLKPYDLSSIGFYDELLSTKRNSDKNPNYKTRLATYKANIDFNFTQYDTNYIDNNLTSMIPRGFNTQQKTDILSLYAYSTSAISKLKIKLTTSEYNRVENTCQNCTIGEVSSFDHFLPKDEFPEFSVHPKNLIPSCSKCNGKKSVNWRNGLKSLFLNLYLDALPDIQYLFVDIDHNLDFTFIIDNRNHINPDLFSIIESHYVKLDLGNRFLGNSNKVVSELTNTITSFKNKLPRGEIINCVIETENSNKALYGSNYWRSILKIELVQNNDFMDSFYI